MTDNRCQECIKMKCLDTSCVKCKQNREFDDLMNGTLTELPRIDMGVAVSVKEKEMFRPCMHDSCTECNGTGRKKNGHFCVHGISCPCPKCTPYCMSIGAGSGG